MMNNESDVMSDITQNQYDWTLRLAQDFKNTHEILLGIAETARKLDYFTPAMRRVVKANSNAIRAAIQSYYESDK